MKSKSIVIALAGSTMLAAAAFAQAPSTTTTAPAATMTTTDAMSHQGQWRASKVVGLKIYNDSNESLGSVNDLLLDKDGKIAAAVIGVGGFLGMGEHYVAVPFEKIKWVNEPVPSTTTANTTTSRPASTTTTTTTGSSTVTTAPKANPWYPDHGIFNATKDELKAMPEFKYST